VTIILYAADTPNGRKISIALEEMEVPYVVRPVCLNAGAQHSSDYLAINPNGKIPAIIDIDQATGEQLSVFESGAILVYLAEKHAQFLPQQMVDRIPVIEWLMWQMGGFGPIAGQVHHFLDLSDENDRRYGLERYSTELRRLYNVLDRRLGTVEYVSGAISIADFAIVAWVWRHQRHGIDLADHPNVRRWYESLHLRKGVQRGFSVELS